MLKVFSILYIELENVFYNCICNFGSVGEMQENMLKQLCCSHTKDAIQSIAVLCFNSFYLCVIFVCLCLSTFWPFSTEWHDPSVVCQFTLMYRNDMIKGYIE